jgi:hypothetical protein
VRAAALVAALPCGWGLGVIAAQLISGPDIGVLPAATIPFGILAAMWFALLPKPGAWTRLAVLVIGTGLFLLFD